MKIIVKMSNVSDGWNILHKFYWITLVTEVNSILGTQFEESVSQDLGGTQQQNFIPLKRLIFALFPQSGFWNLNA